MKEYFLIAGTLLLGVYIGRMLEMNKTLKIYLSIIEEINSYNKKGCE